MHITTIYVYPTETGLPPRALIGHADVEEPEDLETEVEVEGQAVAVFSNDIGCWTLNGEPVPTQLSDAISAHARNLGVPGF